MQVRDKENMMGEELPLKFMEVDEEGARIMFSCRRAQSEDRLASYKVGDVVEGVVANVTFYGAFLEIAPNVIGLLHISQISHDRITNIEKVLAVGDKLKVRAARSCGSPVWADTLFGSDFSIIACMCGDSVQCH